MTKDICDADEGIVAISYATSSMTLTAVFVFALKQRSGADAKPSSADAKKMRQRKSRRSGGGTI
jgi:hypothetical protein